MKAIVHIIAKRDNALPVRRVGYLANKKTLIGPWVGKDVVLNSELLMSDHHGRGRKTRHLVVSLERGADLPDDQFATVAQRFMSAFAPSSEWRGAVDRNTKSPHLHLVIANWGYDNNSENSNPAKSNGGRTLNFSPHVLTRMQNVAEWSGGILDNGKRGAVLEKLTTAKQLVTMNYEQIHHAIEQGSIKPSRINSKNEITSVIIGGKRVRLSTVQRVAAASIQRATLADGDAAHRQLRVPATRVEPGEHPAARHRPSPPRRARARNQGAWEVGTHPAKRKTHPAPTVPQGEPSSLFPTSPRPDIQPGHKVGGLQPLARRT